MVTDPSMSFKHAFVTGATGIVGVALCRKLIEMGVSITAYSRGTKAAVLPIGVDHVQGDILDRDDLVASASGSGVIFHVAAAVHGSASTYEEFEQMNVLGTQNAIRAALETGAKLVHVSTVNVEGFRNGSLADPYAATKSMAEDLVIGAVANGLDAVIVRPASVFGNETGKSGLLVDRLLAGSLKVLPAPSRCISPVWSDDLAIALIRAAEVGISGRVYTVAGPTMSTGDFLKLVARGADVRGPILTIPAVVFAVPLRIAWWTKALTRWTPPVSVESLMNGSAHDGASAEAELGFAYTPISKIFG
ncbi:NAD-dependent epimerase/dehydratase family protein [Candidatus Lucifugimonas marina]|uniref:NAD-dependent epimerase/dehydratase family protein n=1 Tax=Candidatus Lucifugimonas marina TaxID=3038979 RepID=A0AAJ5ZF12_9CHLR|nr:NAD-dependent epimerase/dehydratase family protein [SAR202 cluster bacterium JH702]MDG0868236.1 NAD-dependent epimerase/dehydratase family protein [SAR202 cluster bacterium JH639]WFG34880.1 NAD-dependent epimerase/dehydratase family protein [SAR202 cluster bacterium JH545]WFG38831.1 NAD-dependent epimerase/dehydratase family protein [SAR202 cluster bacterium JH1073]